MATIKDKANPGQNLLRIAQAALELRQFTYRQLADAAGVEISDVNNATREGGLLGGRLASIDTVLSQGPGRRAAVYTFATESDYRFTKEYVASYLTQPELFIAQITSVDDDTGDAQRYLDLAKHALYSVYETTRSEEEKQKIFEYTEMYLNKCWETAKLEDDISSLSSGKRNIYNWHKYYSSLLMKGQRQYREAIDGFMLIAKAVYSYGNIDLDLVNLALFQAGECLDDWFALARQNSTVRSFDDYLSKKRTEYSTIDKISKPVLIKIDYLLEKVSRVGIEQKPKGSIEAITTGLAPKKNSALNRLIQETDQPRASKIKDI